jgi:pyruvate carboxylase subunit B
MKEIKLCLVYRDMWQSSGKYMPRVDQLVRVAPAIIDMGCFARVETNGGGFEQICLLYGENPNQAVREWTQPFNDVGIQTQMLERGLNGIRMSPVGADVRQLMFKVKKKQGTDISRSFDGLNNPQNLALSFQYAREGGMIAQGALSITHSPLHTIDYYVGLADQYIDLGAEEICIKDMAGIGRPVSIGKIVAGIKKRHPKMLVQYHGHSTPGFSVASSLEAARAGADIIDVGMEPLSWGTGHADLLTIHAMLRDAGFSLPDVNTEAYMAARSLSQEFIEDFLGYYINPQNRAMNSLLIGPGLPGGMMGSLMADLEKNLASLNKWLTKNGRETMTQQGLLLKLFSEVEHAWPKLGYPPLVTPFSQYVKNVALMNAINLIKDKERWAMIDENTWGMLLGRSGQLLGELGEEIMALAKAQDREFYTGTPQDLYPNVLPAYREKMQAKGWDTGPDEEELLEYAMHPGQYEAYKSGQAKAQFQEDLAKRKAARTAPVNSAPAAAITPTATKPKNMTITVEGKAYRVEVAYGQEASGSPQITTPTAPPRDNSKLATITAPLEGKLLMTKDSSEKPIALGDHLAVGDRVAYIESMKVINAITTDKAGEIVEILVRHGDDIEEDDIIIRLQ